MVKHMGREVERAEDVRDLATATPGIPVDCDMCRRELLVAALGDKPVVCAHCYELLLGKLQAADLGFDLGI